MPDPTDDELRAYAKQLGRAGGLKCGPARAAALSPELRSEQSRKAARARWDNAPELRSSEIKLLCAFVAAWRVCGRAPTIGELIPIIGDVSPAVAPLLRKRLLVIDEASGTERPTARAVKLLAELGVTGLDTDRTVVRAQGSCHIGCATSNG